MKLSALNTAIRNVEGSVKLRLVDPPITVGLVKSELLAALKDQFDRNEETGLLILDGHLSYEPGLEAEAIGRRLVTLNNRLAEL